MSPLYLCLGLVALPAFAADAGLDSLLKQVETRYNKAKTLQVVFTETYTPVGRPRRTESGTLALQKPGKMRWDYSDPKGKLFVSDGKFLWLYTPADNRAEKMKLKESDDMRAPLAFLLGKLNFKKEFRNIQASSEAGGTRIKAEPSGQDLPYTNVDFLVAADFTIREVQVTGFDRSVLHFRFEAEKVDPKLTGGLFQFKAPPGAQVVDSDQ